jgi:DNA-binding response OmpR family regulator
MTKNPIADPKTLTASVLTITQDLALGKQLQTLLSGISLPMILKESAHAAVQYLKVEAPPQMIILDWSLPENIASRFVQEIRASKRFAHMPLLVIVAEPDPYAIKEALQAGANRYLTQSFIQTGFVRTLKDMQVKTS